MRLRSGWVVTFCVGFIALHGVPNEALAQEAAQSVSPEELLSIHSMVGGVGRSLYRAGNPPVWHPSSESLLFSGRSRAWMISADGGEPVELPIRGGQLSVSPDGTRTAYVSGASGSAEVWLWDFREGEGVQLTDLGMLGIKSISWSPNGQWIAFSGNRYGTFDLWKVSVPGGEVHRLTADPTYEVYPTWTADSEYILYVHMDDRWMDHAIMEMRVDGSEVRRIEQDTDFFDYGGGADFGEPLASPDGQMILFRSYRSGWLNYWLVPREGGTPRPVAADSADQRAATWSPDGRRIAFTSLRNGTHQIQVAEAEGRRVRVLVDPAMGFIKDLQWSPDGERISYVMSTPTQPQELFVVQVADGVSTRLTHSMPDVGVEARLIQPEKVHYSSSDGFTIPAYLYRPRDLQPGEERPAIIRVHGGPTHQYYDHFERNIQFLVEAGYVVLLPNIRGSSGYGREWEDANNGCWGHCDLEDVLAGADYLRELSFVDEENIGIFGRSYGGFMSMAAVAFAPGEFKASIPYGGYGDWEYYRTHGGPSGVRLLEYELGPYPEMKSVYRQSSPIHFLEHATTPTFVIEGGVSRLHYGEGTAPTHRASLDFVREMERLGKPVQYRAYPRWADGDVPYPADEGEMWQDMLEFFDRYLRDGIVSAYRRAEPH